MVGTQRESAALFSFLGAPILLLSSRGGKHWGRNTFVFQHRQSYYQPGTSSGLVRYCEKPVTVQLDTALPPSPHTCRTRITSPIVLEGSGDYSGPLGSVCLTLFLKTPGPGFPSTEAPMVWTFPALIYMAAPMGPYRVSRGALYRT